MNTVEALGIQTSRVLNYYGILHPTVRKVHEGNGIFEWEIDEQKRDEIKATVYDLNHQLVISFHPDDFNNNLGKTYNLTTGEAQLVYPENIPAMANYMLSLIFDY